MTGTLTDAGPMIALIDRDDACHDACAGMLGSIPVPIVTTWPCFTEAMYTLRQAGGHRAQDELWGYVEVGALTFHWPSEEEVARMRVLMRQYEDRPMDLADASLVTTAEALGAARIFSVDSDFYVYRLADGTALEVFPGPPPKR
jgi:predicted nucleic acid-binding protein